MNQYRHTIAPPVRLLAALFPFFLLLATHTPLHAQSTTRQIDTFICANKLPYTWYGQTFTSMGKKTFHLTAAGGGDSTVVLNLHTFKSYNYTVDTAVCEGASVRWLGVTYTADVERTDSYTTVYGCDSIVHFKLFVDHAVNSTVSESVLENDLPYNYLGTNLYGAVSGQTITGRRATRPFCDSIVSYTLIVHENISVTFDSNICYSDLPILWNEHRFTANDLGDATSGTLTQKDTLTRTTGADSIVTLRVIVHPEYLTRDTMNLCPAMLEQEIRWRHTTLPAGSPTGNYNLFATSVYGCDSNFALRLVQRENTSSTLRETTIENNLPHTYRIWTFSTAVTDSVLTIENAYGCDSLITYTLHVYENVNADAYDTICYSQLPYIWNNRTFYASSLTEPAQRTGDIMQQVKLATTHGADSNLTMHLHVKPTFDTTFYDTICASEVFTFNGQDYDFVLTYNRLFQHDDTLRSILDCDSISALRLRVWPTFDNHTYDTVYSTTLPYYFGDYTCTMIGDYPYDTLSIHGCDSANTLHLWVTQVTLMDTSVCNNTLPLRWHGLAFRSTKVDTLTLKGCHGEDSLLVMNVTVRDTSSTVEQLERCDICTWQNGLTYTASTTTPTVRKRNAAGCDSVVHLDLTVHYSTAKGDHIIACNSHTWIDGNTYEATIYGPQHLLHTIHGCDSLVTLDLYVSYSTYDEIMDSMCLGNRYDFRGRLLNRPGTYYDSLLTVDHCDSVTVLHLAELPSPIVEYATRRDCDNNYYFIEISSDVNYITWGSTPFDSALVGHEHDRSVTLNPRSETNYTVHVDYLQNNLCPSNVSFSLAPLRRPKAEMHTSPEYLSYDNNRLEAHDIGQAFDYRSWYVNGFMQEDREDLMSYDVDLSQDSVVVMLEVTSGYCKDSAYAVVPIRKPSMFIPTVFTPYLSTNKYFRPYVNNLIEYEIHIFNRKGQLVFNTRDPNEGWDGKHDGKFCEQGSYVYRIRYRDTAKPTTYQEKSGTVVLLR